MACAYIALALRSRSSELESEFAQIPSPIAAQAATAAIVATAGKAHRLRGNGTTFAAALRAGGFEDSPAQRRRRLRPLGGESEGGDGLLEVGELRRAALALGKVPLEAVSLVGVQRVERVGRDELVEFGSSSGWAQK